MAEVIVTAERRSESVQKVPASITAISTDTIQKFDIQTFSDYAKLAPNLSWGFSTGGASGVSSSRTVIIRGITGSNTTSFYIDDTPLPQSIDPRILDLDHIEILRGPQGTLFGASSMGGTIRLITRPPAGDTVSGDFDGQVFNVNKAPGAGGEFSGSVTAPIVPNAVVGQVSGFASYTPGYLTRTYDDPLAANVTGQPVNGPAHVINNVGAIRSFGADGSLRITPPSIPGLTVTPYLLWQQTTSNGFPLADYNPNQLIQRRILDVPEAWSDEFVFAALTTSYRMPLGRIVSSTSWFTRDTYDQEDGSDATAYDCNTTPGCSDVSLVAVASRSYGFTHTFTQEVRFESSFALPIQFIAGLFYQNQAFEDKNFIGGNGLVQATSGGLPNNIFTSLSHNDTTQVAGYVAVNYDPIENFELSAGVRYSYLHNSSTQTATGLYGFPGVVSTPSSGSPVTPRFSAKYTITPGTMVYATAAQGFRLGGANAPLGGACAGLGLPYPTTTEIPYTSDQLWSYEGGIKTNLADNRVSLTADVYHIDWSRIQQTRIIVIGDCYSQLTLNLGAAVSNGVEFESNYAITRNLSARIAFGYDDAHITSAAPGTEYSVGDPLEGVPKWTTEVAADYKIPQPWGAYFIRGDYTFNGESYSYTEVAPPGLLRKAYELTDVRVGAQFNQYVLTLYAKNLFDARPNLANESPETNFVPGRWRYFVGQPRTVGIEVKYKF